MAAALWLAFRVLGLTIPPERAVQFRNQLAVACAQDVVHIGKIGHAAGAAALGLAQAGHGNDLGRLGQPTAVGVELLSQVGDRAAHAMAHGRAGILDVVNPRAAALLHDDGTEKAGHQEGDGLARALVPALDRQTVEQREADPPVDPVPDPRHQPGRGRQLESRRRQFLDRPLVAAQGAGQPIQFLEHVFGNRDPPIVWLDVLGPPGEAFISSAVEHVRTRRHGLFGGNRQILATHDMYSPFAVCWSGIW